MTTDRFVPRLVQLTAALAMASVFSACAPLIVGGAMLGTGLVAADRRTTGTQIDDEAIECARRLASANWPHSGRSA